MSRFIICASFFSCLACLPSLAATNEMIVPLVFGDAQFGTGLAVSNFGGTSATLTFQFYTPEGGLLVPPVTWSTNSPVGQPGALLPGEQRALNDGEIFGLPATQERRGWVLITSDSDDVRAVYQFYSGSIDQLDGMNAIRQPSPQIYLPWVLNGPQAYRGFEARTEISVVNPGAAAVSVTVSLKAPSGQTLAQTQSTVPPKGMIQAPLSQLFPVFAGSDATIFVETDSASSQGVVACELVKIEGAGSPSFVVANGLPPTDYAGTLYSAQAAQLGGLRTLVRLLNTTATARTASLSIRKEDGSLATDAKELSVPANGFVQVDLATFLSLPDPTVGTLQVVPNGPGVLGAVLFGDPTAGYAAALPLQRPGDQDLVFPHVANAKPGVGHSGIFTGIAIHAPGGGTVDGRIEVLDKNGEPTASNPFSLASGARISKLVSELVSMDEQVGGSVRIKTGGSPLIAQELFGEGALRMLSAVPAFESSYEPLAIPVSKYIVVDQFGYIPQSEKIAVVRDPVTGFDAAESFTPGASYAVVNAHTGRRVLSGAVTSWKNGIEDTSSGDRAWWFDFSQVTTEGDYYILDVDNNVRSAQFRISPDIYRDVLRHAVRVFFYQRVGFAKEAQYAGVQWADAASHIGPLQDRNCRLYSQPGNASTERDLLGGWYDAGDPNKYTSWTAGYVIELLRAYEHAPAAFTDDFGIPESGNGIPDLLDETKWGMDWLVRMQNPDGSVLSIVGEASASPPSAATGPSRYGPANTSATLSTAAAYAYGARVFGAIQRPEYQAYASNLLARAESAWQWAVANPNVLFRNNDSSYGSQGLGAGQQEVDDYGRLINKLEAAAYLFEMTGKSEYRDYFDANYGQVHLIQWSFAFPFESRPQEILLYYSALPQATPAAAAQIQQVYASAMNGQDNFPAMQNEVDPYMAHLKDYTWGSNTVKCLQGGMYLNLIDYQAAPEKAAEARRAAARYIHYIHGVNPLGIVYLSNMYGAGAESSVNEFFHSWFCNGSPRWDRVGVSTYGPPPGFLTGGPNPSYNWDGCCPGSCGSSSNNALCVSEPISPPKGQPKQKSYKDFNTSWPLNSWSVTENSNGYQASYIRLLSRFVPAN